jgi:hypothetical protein
MEYTIVKNQSGELQSKVSHEMALAKLDGAYGYTKEKLRYLFTSMQQNQIVKNVAVFYHHKAMRTTLVDNLKRDGYSVLDGSCSKDLDIETMNRFNNSEIPTCLVLYLESWPANLDLTSVKYAIFPELRLNP